MTNPFLSTPEAATFWRERRKACEEARRLLVKTPEFAAFLAAGGTLSVVPVGFTTQDAFMAMLKDGDTVVIGVRFSVRNGEVRFTSIDIEIFTAWLTEARDGVPS